MVLHFLFRPLLFNHDDAAKRRTVGYPISSAATKSVVVPKNWAVQSGAKRAAATTSIHHGFIVVVVMIIFCFFFLPEERISKREAVWENERQASIAAIVGVVITIRTTVATEERDRSGGGNLTERWLSFVLLMKAKQRTYGRGGSAWMSDLVVVQRGLSVVFGPKRMGRFYDSFAIRFGGWTPILVDIIIAIHNLSKKDTVLADGARYGIGWMDVNWW
jgi:hypothetical protein